MGKNMIDGDFVFAQNRKFRNIAHHRVGQGNLTPLGQQVHHHCGDGLGRRILADGRVRGHENFFIIRPVREIAGGAVAVAVADGPV